MKPLARTDRLIKQVVDQDTLVYDPADDTACCLNALASAVWRHCDGEHTVEEIATLVSREMELPVGAEPEMVVWRVVDELEEHHLIAMPVETAPESAGGGMPRREVLRVALAGIALFPSIQSITGPTLAHATSPAPSLSASNTPAVSPSNTATETPTATATPTTSRTPTRPAPTATATVGGPTPTPTPTRTATQTPTQTQTASQTPTASQTRTPLPP